jgi:hypothetical protein
VAGVEAVNGLRLFVEEVDDDGAALGWAEMPAGRALPLADYQLPELMAVAVQIGEAEPAPPQGFASGGGAANAPSGGTAVPVPVIPDLC